MTDEKEELTELVKEVERNGIPKADEYQVIKGGPGIDTEVVADGIRGKYHAMYIRDKARGKFGHIGVSYSIERVDE